MSKSRPIEHRPPTEATVKALYATAFRCGHPTCQKPLYRMSDTTGDLLLNSTVAHIHARRENGPRWDATMTEAENRAASNLILLCLEHSREVDDVPDKYPADDLREWKVSQFAEYEALQRSWPLTDEQAAEVVEVSFTPDRFSQASVSAAAVVHTARLATTIVETARRHRRSVLQIVAEYEARVEWYTTRSMIWDDQGERLVVQPPRTETDQYSQRLRAALATAVEAIEPLVMELSAELAAVKAASPALGQWCDWCSRCASAVAIESGKWSAGSEDAFEAAVADLGSSSEAVVAAWRGEEPAPPPSAPEPVPTESESDEARDGRVHRATVERARPWGRVHTRAYDEETYNDLVHQLPYASRLAPVVSHLAFGLDATAALAAAVARNADEETLVSHVDAASRESPLAIAVYLVHHLKRVAGESGKEAVALDAGGRLETLLQAQQWTDVSVWESNEMHCRGLLDYTAQVCGEETVSQRLREAIPIVGPAAVLAGFASWREQFLDLDFSGPSVIRRYMGDLPGWLPNDVLLAAIRQEWPEVEGDADADGTDVESLAAQFVASAAGGE